MVSHFMQGGDVCENAPGLRIDTNNMEIAALMAPRPMLMVSATGDWTTDTPRIEYPALRAIYNLFEAADRIEERQFPFQHNYNRSSRETVYGFFAKWLDGKANQERIIQEKGHFDLDPGRLLVFARRGVPDHALGTHEVFDRLLANAHKQCQDAWPQTAADLERYRALFWPIYRAALMVEWPVEEELRWWETNSSMKPKADRGAVLPVGTRSFIVSRASVGDRVPVMIRGIAGGDTVALVVSPGGWREASEGEMVSTLNKHVSVVTVDVFQTGAARDERRQATGTFFATYNRTDDVERVQDILTAAAWIRHVLEPRKILLIGEGISGLWCLLARPFLPSELNIAVAADAKNFRSDDDGAYLEELHIPLLRRAGDFRSAAALAPSSPLFIHRTAEFGSDAYEGRYRLEGAGNRLRVKPTEATVGEIEEWMKGTAHRA
jgi:hypothetical protein